MNVERGFDFARVHWDTEQPSETIEETKGVLADFAGRIRVEIEKRGVLPAVPKLVFVRGSF